jgi:hypothetical protein
MLSLLERGCSCLSVAPTLLSFVPQEILPVVEPGEEAALDSPHEGRNSQEDESTWRPAARGPETSRLRTELRRSSVLELLRPSGRAAPLSGPGSRPRLSFLRIPPSDTFLPSWLPDRRYCSAPSEHRPGLQR